MNKRFQALEIIREWDPIGLKDITPYDEYMPLVEEIFLKINDIGDDSKKNIEAIAQIIHTVFTQNFCKYSNDIYSSTVEDCKKVAQEILSIM